MLDFFTIFSKGGIVLWCFQGVSGSFTGPVNALIRSVILQERGGNAFTHEALTLKYKLDNEFELVFVVGFQKILTLTYVDKFIDDIHLLFRDRYRNQLKQNGTLGLLNTSFEFQDDFLTLLRVAEESSRTRAPKAMKSFDQSEKARKTVASMIETRGDTGKVKGKENNKKNKNAKKEAPAVEETVVVSKVASEPKPKVAPATAAGNNEGLSAEEIIQLNREKFMKKFGTHVEKSNKSPKPDKQKQKKGKEQRIWPMGGSGTSAKDLDYSNSVNGNESVEPAKDEDVSDLRGKMAGDLRDLEYESSSEEEESVEKVAPVPVKESANKRGFGGMFGMLRGLVGSKSLSRDDLDPVLDRMKDHLIAKNVAAEIAAQLCESVAKKLEGKVMGTFSSVTSTVKQALQESLVQILQPKRRVDILRDSMEAQRQRRPYVITFCGVNGVGKSTNLAKICFWLIENGFSVLIAACDTFRAGAVEQLRTHTRRLNSLHPPEENKGRILVQLYEKGYGKDAAGIAMEAISYARNQGFDVVLVDTAGRMQDNAPLMTALAKLIAVNVPDLVLFVGEALVGNEAVDQLVKFNQALADHSMSDRPRLIDGIVLTKFDTIDDKVGAAISMTYITGQPIVFVGTGQTYSDLRSLNAKAVVSALMKA
ncbi:signal recognition particle receptor subunit alpha isoform X2 [Protopterus annectens]|uniref:signal recognition particle receptor subunit alpha isoform X2 n=1 Tax=Protopterus annectens TaxID=7888 RepID=UPI001CFC2D78|nr:signal recognition particle receptor subunit alpha isoform X2 [Protopterus annectens]